ncbi:MAG: hypothetical protein ACR2HR_15845 [Euzebya sp.]
MKDPWEGVDAEGQVVTGVSAARIPSAFMPLIQDSVATLRTALDQRLHSIHLYGSVATGQAVAERSDLDLLLVLHQSGSDEGLLPSDAAPARSIGTSTITMADLLAPTEQAQVERCFLDHYTVGLWGPQLPWTSTPCAATVELARGFSAGLLTRLPAVDDQTTGQDALTVWSWADSQGERFGTLPGDHRVVLRRLARWVQTAWTEAH